MPWSDCQCFKMPSIAVCRLILMTSFIIIMRHQTVTMSLGLSNNKPVKTRWKLKQDFMYSSEPEQIHIAFGDKINDIVVVWATRTNIKRPFVQYGTTAENLVHSHGETVYFETSNDNGAKYWHRALLPNLHFGELYHYRVTSVKGSTDSELYSFSVPVVSHRTVNSFLVLADMGLETKSLNFLVYEALNRKYDAVFHIGDITEGLGSEKGTVGDTYLKKIQKMTATIPYLTCPGDHERFHDFVHYRYRFSMPHTPWPMPMNQLWYSVDIGNAHFITINTEDFVTADELRTEQLVWLEYDLKMTNRRRMEHPWVIVFGHRPLYSSCYEHDIKCTKSMIAVRKHLDDILFKYGVDIYIGGHDHHYERTYPVYNSLQFGYGYKNPMATVHVTIGAMGSNVHETKFYSSKKAWSSFMFKEIDKELYGRLDIVNASHILWEVFNANNNALVDRMHVIQWRHGSFGEPGKEAYQKSIERQNIPMQPPIPIGYETKRRRNLKSQGFLGPANNMLMSVDAGGSRVVLSLITIFIFILIVILFSRRMKKKVRSCCTFCNSMRK